MGLIRIPGGGWWEFEGEEPPGFIFTSRDEGGDPDTVRKLFHLVDNSGGGSDQREHRRRPSIPEEIQMSTRTMENPLSSAQVRLECREKPSAPAPGSDDTRPFGMRSAQIVPTPVRPSITYCPVRQLAVGDDGRPLLETMKKEWATKSSTDGDEGPEENWGWEEEADE